jgi:hypothetical protein
MEPEADEMKAKKKAKLAPLRIKCGTCFGSGWLWSGVGHFGEQDGGHKDCGAQCPACLGLGYLEGEDKK